MPKPPRQNEPSLVDLRREIDRIDEAMHALLIERGEIIERLIAVKKTEESGSAFRPAREADMMRRLVQRHHGSLPLDTAESIWRVIISTFTYVQAPFAVHADLSAGDALMRDSARFHFGFTVPFVPHMGAASVVQAVTASKGDLGLVPAFAIAGSGPWWTTLEFDTAPKIIARLPFVERADHPAGMPVFVVSRVAADAMVTETEVWSVRVSGWTRRLGRQARRPRRCHRGPRPRVRRRRLAHLGRAWRHRPGRGRPSWRPAPRSARGPSSAATRPAIRCRTSSNASP